MHGNILATRRDQIFNKNHCKGNIPEIVCRAVMFFLVTMVVVVFLLVAIVVVFPFVAMVFDLVTMFGLVHSFSRVSCFELVSTFALIPVQISLGNCSKACSTLESFYEAHVI